MSGQFYIVATPIGNLADISQRAISTLQSVALIAAEDTRHSKKLLQHYQINTPLISLHEFNELDRIPFLLEKLQSGESVALISDAGTPLISDPGYRVVSELRKAGITVIPIPGACALISALVASGMPCDRFVFEGFLPVAARQQRLMAVAKEQRTLIFYEAPHRIIATLEAMQTVFGAQRQAVLAKELTKQYEMILNGSLTELLAWLHADKMHLKGEFIILVAGLIVTRDVDEEAKRLLSLLLAELSVKQAVRLVARMTGKSKRQLYQLALQIQEIIGKYPL